MKWCRTHKTQVKWVLKCRPLGEAGGGKELWEGAGSAGAVTTGQATGNQGSGCPLGEDMSLMKVLVMQLLPGATMGWSDFSFCCRLELQVCRILLVCPAGQIPASAWNSVSANPIPSGEGMKELEWYFWLYHCWCLAFFPPLCPLCKVEVTLSYLLLLLLYY